MLRLTLYYGGLYTYGFTHLTRTPATPHRLETASPPPPRSRRTRLLEDQLWPADAGSWQIADRYTVASSAAHRIAVGGFRVHFVVEL